jgi:immune inhibitor A
MHCCNNGLCLMPPSPDVFRELGRKYKESGVADRISFAEYLKVVGFVDPSSTRNGMDDGFLQRLGASGPELFSIPQFKVTGQLELKVLLVDFADLPGTRAPAEYTSLLFEQGRQGSGSLTDYYAEVSQGKVQISGTVDGWLRMPRPYQQYTSGRSGMGASTYPNNAQGMAEDAVREALRQGVQFAPSLDKLQQGIITALFIVHAGPGAEVLPSALRGGAIWSHKWLLRQPIQLQPNLAAAVYLTVPENCELGVCAHELGHLAFQWEDFYDANYDDDGDYWDGSGDWDLMASGSYNGGGRTPAYPVGLHRLQHGWIESQVVTGDPGQVKPFVLPPNRVLLLRSPVYQRGQYLLVENRQPVGFDSQLPGHGLLVWRVDESRINTTSTTPGLFLLDANQDDSWQQGDYNQGDAGDPFPGTAAVRELDDIGHVSTTFPGFARSGLALRSIQERSDGVVTFDVQFK